MNDGDFGTSSPPVPVWRQQVKRDRKSRVAVPSLIASGHQMLKSKRKSHRKMNLEENYISHEDLRPIGAPPQLIDKKQNSRQPMT